MKHPLSIIPLCLLPLLGQAQVNVIFGDIKFDQSQKRVYLSIENHTPELLMLAPYEASDRHKDTYSCITYRVEDNNKKILYDSNVNPKPMPQYAGDHFKDPSWYNWPTDGQLPLLRQSWTKLNTWLIPYKPELLKEKEAYEKCCVFSCYLDSMPENSHTLEVDLHIRLYPMPNLSVDEKDKEKISEDAYLIPKPVQPPILYETEMHKTFKFGN